MSNRWIDYKSEIAQTMAEYTVVLGVITFAIVLTLSFLSDAINAGFERTLEVVNSAF